MLEFGIWFWIWVVLAAFLLVAEIFTAGFFMLPFGIGAACSAVLAALDVPLVWQWVTFIAVSAVCFVLLRRFADRITREQPVRTGVDRLIGKTGSVIEDLTPDSPLGQVRIDREIWRADAPDTPDVIPVGARVRVDRVEGTHLIVHPTE
ncbi:MAG: NfeD family protein [Coriobacteriia bacterium]|jgi:membrane protein implicated in regulation of membrane protease activity|nr:NfeD family protein [Coriobacteriia bacterium]